MRIELVSKEHTTDALLRSIRTILSASELCSMATITEGGEPHIHTAYFCFDDALQLYFVSDTGTVHSQNLLRSPAMAVAVADSRQPWDEPHCGLQMFGEARLASLTESAKALAIHAARFHAYGEYIKALSIFDRESMPYKFYVFSPQSIKIFDEPVFGEETFVVADVRRR